MNAAYSAACYNKYANILVCQTYQYERGQFALCMTVIAYRSSCVMDPCPSASDLLGCQSKSVHVLFSYINSFLHFINLKAAIRCSAPASLHA